DPQVLDALLEPAASASAAAAAATGQRPETVQAALDLYMPRLVAYQNRAYAERFRILIKTLQEAEQRVKPQAQELTLQAAHSLYKLMAYKDEYEVARLFSSSSFMDSLQEQFEEGFTLNLHLAPPFITRLGSDGRQQKRRMGSWILRLMPWLARAKFVRGSVLDVFGYQAERKMERALRDEFITQIEKSTGCLNEGNYEYKLQLVRLPQEIRGFGPVKEVAVERYRARQNQLLQSEQDSDWQVAEQLGNAVTARSV